MLLWKHILRAHLAPFLFANGVVIFLFLLQFLMKSAGELVGKGLSVWVILELIALNLAWIVVLAVPMSVLVSTLMAFGRLSADNEIIIMRACGMSLYRMMAPVLLAAGALAWGLIVFNNDVLPDANIRLRTLMTDIIRIKPTLTLQSGVFTSDEDLPNYRILVRRTFEKSNVLEGVTIYDLSQPEKNVVVTAQRGTVSFSPDYSKIFMNLESGEIHELDREKDRSYRMLCFTRHRVAIPAAGFAFQRSDASSAQRDDRTMSAPMMAVIVDSTRANLRQKEIALGDRLARHIARYLGNRPEFFTAAPSQPMRPEPAAAGGTRQDSLDAGFRALTDARQMQSVVLSDVSAMTYDDRQMDKYLVEIHKKYAIPVACVVFVLIGVPLGSMSRRSGFGIGAGLSLGFFLFYWVCLISGEKLADRAILSPQVGMWIANALMGACGLVMTVRSARESTVIDWTRFGRLLPRGWRGEAAPPRNPHEAS